MIQPVLINSFTRMSQVSVPAKLIKKAPKNNKTVNSLFRWGNNNNLGFVNKIIKWKKKHNQTCYQKNTQSVFLLQCSNSWIYTFLVKNVTCSIFCLLTINFILRKLNVHSYYLLSSKSPRKRKHCFKLLMNKSVLK
jgi:hypothetical protein